MSVCSSYVYCWCNLSAGVGTWWSVGGGGGGGGGYALIHAHIHVIKTTLKRCFVFKVFFIACIIAGINKQWDWLRKNSFKNILYGAVKMFLWKRKRSKITPVSTRENSSCLGGKKLLDLVQTFVRSFPPTSLLHPISLSHASTLPSLSFSLHHSSLCVSLSLSLTHTHTHTMHTFNQCIVRFFSKLQSIMWSWYSCWSFQPCEQKTRQLSQ